MEWLLVVGALVLSVILTGSVRRIALRRNILDIPNERSSHTTPTPRSGGIGFVVVFFVGMLLLYSMGEISAGLLWALLIGGIILAITGYVDDIRHLSPYVRLALQFIAAVIGVMLVKGIPKIDLGFTTFDLGWIGYLLAVIGIVWLINLYNFMDGIDGIAGAEAVETSLIVALLLFGTADDLAWACLLLAAACLGFLYWNWSPARIFMGDVGSGFLGYVLAILAIASGQCSPTMLWVWLILLGIFVVDTLITLINRVRRGEKWHQAHRSHAYQHAVMRWKSHPRVTGAVILINLLWLTPCAVLVKAQPQWSLPITLVALLPLVGLALYFRAGIDNRMSNKPREAGVSEQTV